MELPFPQITPQAMRRTLGQFCTGVTVVTAQAGELVHAMTANAFTSVSLDPPLVLVCIDKRARMHSHLSTSGRFGVSVLSSQQERLAWHFAGRPLANPGELFEREGEGMAFVKGAIACIGCRVHAQHDAGDHDLYVGHVVRLCRRPGEPLLFHAGQFGLLERVAWSDAWT